MSPKSIALKVSAVKSNRQSNNKTGAGKAGTNRTGNGETGASRTSILKKLASRRNDTTVYYSTKTGLPIEPKARKEARLVAAKNEARLAAAKKVAKKPKNYRNLIKSLFSAGKNTRLKLTESDLINAESALGATLFGPIPKGHRREFFRFKHNVWIYHESWMENGKKFESTITYEVRENGVYKLPLGGEYTKLKGRELENFCKAAAEYLKLIKTKLY